MIDFDFYLWQRDHKSRVNRSNKTVVDYQ